MIKRFPILMTLFALAAISVSCVEKMQDFPDPVLPGEGIVLKLDTGDMVLSSKAGNAGERDGDYTDEYINHSGFNENKLGSAVDVFFYTADATDNDPSVFHGSIPLGSGSNLLQIPVSIGSINAIFEGTAAGNTATVIVVANYDGTAFTHAEDYSANGMYSKAQLRTLALARANWAKHPQDDFVMISDEATLTLVDANSSTPASGTVKMRRVAAKVTFRLTVADEIVVENYTYDSDNNVTKTLETWRPKTGAMTIYPQYFMKDAVLGGTPTPVPANVKDASLYTGVDTPYMLVETSETVQRERTVFVKDEQGNYIFDEDTQEYETEIKTVSVPIYKTMYAEYTTVQNDQTGQNETHATPTNIEGPFYSYPVTWDAGIASEPFLKLIIPWETVPAAGTGQNSRTKYYYYKIPFTVSQLEANNWYEVTLDVQILGGEDDLPVPLEANYHVVDWVPGTSASASTVSARYLSVPTKFFNMYNSEELEIPMLSSHPCEITSVTVTKPQYGSSTYINTTVDFTNATGPSEGKWSLNSLEEIDFVHTLSNEMGEELDCAPYTITFRVQQKDDTDYYAIVTIVQYPGIYIEKKTGGNTFVDGYYCLVTGGKPEQNAGSKTPPGGVTYYYHQAPNFSVDGGYRITPYGNLTSPENSTAQQGTGGTRPANAVVPTSETEMTVIHVTAFTDNYHQYEVTENGNTIKKDYIIGDPRIPFNESTRITTKSLTNYLTPRGTNNTTSTWSTDQYNALKVGTEVDNIIAPAFMLASEWGRQGSGTSSWETVAKRCATYQEKGYPAGRWRLPTEAEVMFCVNLQINHFIGELFKGGTYWISNGRGITRNGTFGTGNSTRCVYDVWYWGEDPVTSENNPDYNAEYKDYYYYVMP